eukprot:3676231-Prymnesium_polylepis.1
MAGRTAPDRLRVPRADELPPLVFGARRIPPAGHGAPCGIDAAAALGAPRRSLALVRRLCERAWGPHLVRAAREQSLRLLGLLQRLPRRLPERRSRRHAPSRFARPADSRGRVARWRAAAFGRRATRSGRTAVGRDAPRGWLAALPRAGHGRRPRHGPRARSRRRARGG